MTTDTLSRTFAALADPTRRAMLARLAQGEATVNELAAPFDMSLPNISKHLKVLQGAGLVVQGREGQFRPCRLDPEALPGRVGPGWTAIARPTRNAWIDWPTTCASCRTTTRPPDGAAPRRSGPHRHPTGGPTVGPDRHAAPTPQQPTRSHPHGHRDPPDRRRHLIYSDEEKGEGGLERVVRRPAQPRVEGHDRPGPHPELVGPAQVPHRGDRGRSSGRRQVALREHRRRRRTPRVLRGVPRDRARGARSSARSTTTCQGSTTGRCTTR